MGGRDGPSSGDRGRGDQYDPVYEDDSNPAAWLEGMSLPAFCLLIVLGLFYLAVDALWNRWNR